MYLRLIHIANILNHYHLNFSPKDTIYLAIAHVGFIQCCHPYVGAGMVPIKFITHINPGEKDSLSTSVLELTGHMGFSRMCWQVKLEDVLIFVLFSETESYYVD